MINLTAKKVSL